MTYPTKNLAFFSNLDGMQAICEEKMFAGKLPQSRLRRASPLKDGAFGITVQFPAQAQSLRARQRLPPRGSCQNRQVLTEGVQPTRSLPAAPPLPQEAGAAAAVCRYDPTREKGFLKSPQTFQKPKI